MIASLRLTALMLGMSVYLCFGLLMAGVLAGYAYFYPFAFNPDNPYLFVGGQIFRTLVIALGGYFVAKKAAPVGLFNVIVYASIIAISVFIVSLFSQDSFYLERILSAVTTGFGAYLGYSFFKDGQSEDNFVGENG